ncbi:hypothetical protein NKH77_46010 [Streptomyces sp. M19]
MERARHPVPGPEPGDPSPTASTTPAASESGTRPGGTGIVYRPPVMGRSRALRELARTRTSSWPAAGTGTGRSAGATGPPSPLTWKIRIVRPPLMVHRPMSRP